MSYFFLLIRVLLGLMFLLSGLGKFFETESFVRTLSHSGVPFTLELVLAAGLLQVICGPLLILGAYTRLAAPALAAFTVIVTVLVHNFWSLSGEIAERQMIYALKNVVIFGLLMALVKWGPGRFALRRRATD
ncbi:MAG: DoxX family protein [Pseudomonadota bacterium]